MRSIPAIARFRGLSEPPPARESKKALANATACFTGIIASAMDAIISLDADQHIILFNPAAERMFDIPAQDVLGSHVNHLLPERFRAAHSRHIERFAQTGVSNRQMGSLGKIYGLRANGQEFPIEASISQAQVGEERIFTVILRDISLREQAERAQARLAAIVQSSDDAILSKNLDGIITTWNPAAQRLFGYSPDEIIGQSITRLIPPDRQAEEALILARLRRGEHIRHYETVRLDKEGRRLDVSLSISPLRDTAGTIIGVSKIIRDITQRKNTEQDLRTAREALTRANQNLEQTVQQRTAKLQETIAELEAFCYSLSHDMRAPLRAIQSFAAILQDRYGRHLNQDATTFIGKIIRSAQRMDQLIQDVLGFSRLSRQQIQLQPVNVEKLLRDILHERPEFQAPQACIRIDSPLPRVLGHEAALTQCFTNLLANAVKFVARGVTPQVRIRAEGAGKPARRGDGEPESERRERVRIWVEDNGIGIPPDAQRRLFELFQRHHTTLGYEGTGIGLAIVRKAVERMNGRVGVQSEPGKGSRFWVELPLAPA